MTANGIGERVETGNSEQRIESALTDTRRLGALRATELLGAPPHAEFDRLTRIATRIVGAPVAFVSLIDAARDFYLSHCGFPEPLASRRMLEGRTFCHYTLLSPRPLVINDALASPEYRDVPTVRSLGVQAYLGVPLRTESGEHLGSFCMIDFQPREWRAADVELVEELAHATLREIALQSQVNVQGAQLRQSRTQLQTIIDALPSMVGYYDAQLRNQYANTAYARYFGCTAQELAGRHAREVLGDALYAAYLPMLERVLAGESVSFRRELAPPSDGPALHTMAHCIPDIADGQVQGFLVMVHDVTPLQQAEEARARVARTLRLVKDVNLAVARADSHQELLDRICELVCEDGGYRLAWIGYAQDDAGKSFRQVARAGDAAYLRGSRISWDADSPYGQGPGGRALRSGEPQVVNDIAADPSMWPWQGTAQDNGLRSLVAIPFTKKSGVRGCFFAYAGHTDAFGADEVRLLRELTSNLTFGLDSLADRNRRIAAESANIAKSSFLANMSHEIRSPLHAIMGMSHLVRKEPLTAQQQERMGKLDEAARHLSATIDDILDLSKIEAGRLQLQDEPVDLVHLVAGVVDMLQQAADAKGIRLTHSVAPLDVPLQGDATRLRQALLNYASNAVKFTERGAVALRMQVQDGDDKSLLLRFEVQDTGIGIAPDACGRLFSAFEQADKGLTRRFGGTGLGLAITKKLAEAMGGEVGVHSREGEGSCFWLTVRLLKGVRAEPVAQVPQASPLERLQACSAGKRVLLAEDDPFNQEIGRMVLSDAGFDVDVADDGNAAVALARAGRYDLVLMDMQMPHLDGPSAARRIRTLDAFHGVPIIAMTASAFAEDRALCIDAGMNDFITKPVQPDALYTAILRWL